MKKLLGNNLTLKVMSGVMAFILWFLVMNIENPVATETIDNVPVTITNGSYLESMGLTAMLSQVSTVRVSVTANRSVVDNISPSDVVVTADLTQIVSMDSDPVMVPITAVCTKYPNLSADNITTYPGSIAIQLEDLKSESYVVTPSAGGTIPAKEYEVGMMSALPEQVTITGPESLVNKIDKVIAKVSVTNLSEDTVLSGAIEIIDKNQDQFNDSQLAQLKIKGIKEDGTVDVSVSLWRLVSGVNIKASSTGSPKIGYKVGEITAVPAELSIVGTEEALAVLVQQNNEIIIPGEYIDVTGKSADFETKIDIIEFLPEGIRLAKDVASSVIINTQILPDGSKAFKVPISNITQMNLNEIYMVSYDTDSIDVRIKGTESVLNTLLGENITGTIDLTGLAAGTHTVPVEIQLPSGLFLVHEAVIDITITETEVATAVGDLEE